MKTNWLVLLIVTLKQNTRTIWGEMQGLNIAAVEIYTENSAVRA
jgi:hypothetical protein